MNIQINTFLCLFKFSFFLLFLINPQNSISQHATSQNPALLNKAIIKKDGTISLVANLKKDHRIFGYKKRDTTSQKMILLSVFTNDVENNIFNCKYGAFYDTRNMKELKLQYTTIVGDFISISILKKGKFIDTIYMLKAWFEIE